MLLQYNKSSIETIIELNGSKSISNRLLILKDVLNLPNELVNLSSSKDTQTLLALLRQMHQIKNHHLDVGDAGTDMRFLTALLCTKDGEWTITGSERMKERPIQHLVDALKLLGAEISYLGKEGFPPLKIIGKKLRGGKIEVDGSISSQFISALLLIAPALENGLEIQIKNKTVSWSYILMTLDILSQFGIRVSTVLDTIRVSNTQSEVPNQPFRIESDWSAASYWFSFVALAPNAKIILKGLQKGSSQGDSVLPEIYQNFGVASEYNGSEFLLTKTRSHLKHFEYDFTNCPDIAQTVAVTCFALKISCTLTGLSTLKNKETDRLLALKTELEKLGAKVEITDDSFQMDSKRTETINDKTLIINTYGDHRMAMSFAPLVCELGQIQLNDPSVVNKSYPEFWEDLKKAGISAQ